jgi:hypothetical protein
MRSDSQPLDSTCHQSDSIIKEKRKTLFPFLDIDISKSINGGHECILKVKDLANADDTLSRQEVPMPSNARGVTPFFFQFFLVSHSSVEGKMLVEVWQQRGGMTERIRVQSVPA